MAANKAFRFFDLPPELRGAVFSQLLVSDESIILHDTTFFTLPSAGNWNFLNVFLVNMQMYQEASAIFYSMNRFTLNAHSHRLPVHLTSRGGFLSEEGKDARRRVRNLTLYLTRVGGEFERVIGPALSDMVLNGNLRELVMRLGPPSSLGASRPPERDMEQRPPFQALLRLLADPYLEKVKLLAWKAHLAIFCPFHLRINSSRTDTESVDNQGIAILRNSTGWVELDWRAMVDVYAPGQKIVRIGDRTY
ncbi:uncharacterized protein GGS22DRAFT_49068 [Annulohypoxylon maeteangense]|uniref:uncharacterized protein n=1 Tax=Annulohypoxylon maeteangense TaxID=1927788 RepID=UPI002007BE2A|nr:uncharacterized protein GGS22DRAFT_49068 [Annulohypoxylon maeteangense]KAI0882207.1 hypothetical protein GGS22DRAFT_49068 [Annulohypoxylon maeteangense]